MSQRVSIMFVFLLVMQTVLSELNLHASTVDATGNENIELSLQNVKDENGEIIDLDEEREEDADVVVSIAWKINGTVEAGTTGTLELPDGLVVTEGQSGDIVVDGSLLVKENNDIE